MSSNFDVSQTPAKMRAKRARHPVRSAGPTSRNQRKTMSPEYIKVMREMLARHRRNRRAMERSSKKR